MARPFKTGLDYFPLDVYMDDAVELLEAECGLEGFAILIKLWQKIYSEGYYIEWNRDTSLLFSRKSLAPAELVCKVVDVCLQREIFSHMLYNKYSILTSCGIQKRYLIACNQSKRKMVPMIKEYMLINSTYSEYVTEVTELTPEETHITEGVKPEETLVSPGESTQRKGKERKGDKIDTYIEIVDYLNQKLGTNYRPSTKNTQSLIDARLANDFTVEDFKKVIDIKAKEWLNTDQAKYLRPETLFGNKFESYLNQIPTTKPNQSTGRNMDGIAAFLENEGE